MRIFIKIILSILILYLFSMSLFYFFQERFIFQPEKLSKDFEFNYKNQDVEEYNIKVKKGVEINGLHFKTKKPKGVVYYLKG